MAFGRTEDLAHLVARVGGEIGCLLDIGGRRVLGSVSDEEVAGTPRGQLDPEFEPTAVTARAEHQLVVLD
jgi:hypothetical protein